MPGYYFDEQASERLTEALVGHGLDATSANRLGNKGLSDALHLLIAARAQRALVTYDTKDFTLLHEAWHAWSRAWGITDQHAGILLIYSAPRLSIEEVAEAVRQFDREHAGTSTAGRLFSWKRGTGWKEIL
jgi:hypothetical protein